MLSSANRAEMGEGQARQTAAALLGGAVADLSRVAGGGNNRLFQVAAADGASPRSQSVSSGPATRTNS